MTTKLLLPRGITVKEKVNPGRVNLPEALEKLRNGRFTGYLRFDTPKGTGALIFHQGRLTEAAFEGGQSLLLAFDAIARIFEQSLLGHRPSTSTVSRPTSSCFFMPCCTARSSLATGTWRGPTSGRSFFA